MSLEMLEKFATESGNEEIVGAVNAVKESYKSNVDRLTFLEKDMKKAVEKRDSVTGLIKNKLGVDDVSEEALDSAITSLKSKKDSSNDAEIANLSTMLDMIKTEKEGLQNKYNETVNTYKLEKELTKIGAVNDTETAKAYDILLGEIKQGAEFDDNGNIMFKSNDGTTIRNADGSPTTLADRYAQLKDSEELSFLFKKTRSKAGSGSNAGSPAGGVTSLKDLNEAQRVALFKQDPEQYKRLASLN